ncbi:hypothetical protein QCA50_020060 [Cerrena zonata]|uniref:Cytochrome P450 n=1 Tax=Cerrena zonata TaxID=2478898 RepID=A0AAW0FB02_9APHY
MSLLQTFATLVLAWAVWQVFRAFIAKSALDNILDQNRLLGGEVTPLFVLRRLPLTVCLGNLDQLFDRHGWKFQDDLGERYGPVVKLQSLLGRKALFVFDPLALQNIIIKDQYIYEPPEWATTSFALVFGPGVLATYGERHRRQRKMLNPVFSIKHMRYMTPIFYRVAYNLQEGIKNHINDAPKDIDLLHWVHRTALELVGQGGLGYSFDSLKEDVPYTAYARAMKDLIASLFHLTPYRLWTPYFKKLGPKWFRRWLLDRVPIQGIQRLKEMTDVVYENTRRVFFEKKAALEAGDAAVKEQVANGKDIMSILLRENMKASDEDKLSEEELLGQMSLLVFAATDTTTSALAQTFQLLAQHRDVQEKVRAEIKEAKLKARGDIPHDELMALPYLDSICRETLRMYPPVTFMTRETRKDVLMPLSQPIRGVNGQLMSEIPVPKATTILVGVRASNMNASIWGEDVKEWKPERWLDKLPESVTDAHLPGVYSNLMTFNGGGRSCVGFKFSQLEMKVVMAVLLESFDFSMPDNGKDVVWNLAGVRYPTVGRESKFAEFPMKVTPIDT